MVLLVRHRYAHYRRYLLDIWGVVRVGTMDLERPEYALDAPLTELGKSWLSSHRLSELLDQGSRRKTRLLLFFYKLWERRRMRRYKRARKFVYRIELHGPQRFRRYRRPTFLGVRLVRLFYLTYNYRQLRRLVLGAHGKVGFYEENLAFALESRLMCFLYRTGFVSTLFSSIDFIRHSFVLINHAPFSFIHHKVKLGDLVSFPHQGAGILYPRLLKRLQKKASLFPPAPFLFVSFALLCAYYKRPPRFGELVFPLRMNLHSVVNYFGGRK
jgi:hypothetical protein